MVQLFDEFKVMSSCTMIILDRWIGSEIGKYLSKFNINVALIWDCLLSKSLLFTLHLFSFRENF